MSAPGDIGGRAAARPLPALAGPIPALFCTAGAVVGAVGALPWLAVLFGAGGVAWPLLVLATVALVVGGFAVLVGIGLFRARNAMRAEGTDCAVESACAGCDATCALSALRS